MIRKIRLIFILFVSVFMNTNLTQAQGTVNPDNRLYLNNPLYRRYIELFKMSKIKKANIVMLGDSRTDGAEWNDLLGNKSVVKRSIPGDILDGYLARMKYVYNLHPKICFVQGGVNDIFNWIPTEQIFKKYVKVIEGLRKKGIIPVIQSTVYVSPVWGKEWLKEHRPYLKPREVNKERNMEIKRLNKMLKKYAEEHNIIFIDLNKKFSRNGFLMSSLTWDGAHYKSSAYKIWASEVLKVLNKLKIK